jgi:thiamine kinase-like enzyme
MTNFKILICEDNSSDKLNIELHIKSVIRELVDFGLSYESVDFESIFQELENDYDLIILDLYDEKSSSDKGSQVLMHNAEKNKIPTIIYTSVGDNLEFDLNSKKSEYPFLLGKFTKMSNSGEEIKRFLKGYIISSNGHKFYHVYNKNDKKLNFAIKHLGDAQFNFILYSFKSQNEIKDDIIVYPMTLGWSGAVLFKLKINNDFHILKLSKDIEGLKKELENSKRLYSNFPSQLINPIFPLEYYSFDNSVFGFSIKSIEESTPLLSFIISKNTKPENIKKILNELYLSTNSLKNHYSLKKNNNNGDWTSIYDKINEGKIEWIIDSYKNLKIIVDKFYPTINIENFRSLCIYDHYINLNNKKLLDDSFKKDFVLSHGDFHANNILIQGERPFIIDTGAMRYQHWALDIARLIVSLYILGFDKDKFEYFDLNRIEYNIKIGENIIDLIHLEINDSEENSNISIAINWIIDNIQNIYETQFSLFEFQLALMKEFLQVSYRIETVPPNKRALALILAEKCLIKANLNVSIS